MTTFALLPAAGHSKRMGQPKLGLPLGDQTILGSVIRAIRQAGIDKILVVLGPHVAALEPIARASGAEVLLLSEATPDMRSTVQHGLDCLGERWAPQPDDRWLLVPADHPTLDPAVIAALGGALDGSAGSIALPIHHGKRGHPALISWRHASGLSALPAGQGLNTYLRQFPGETIELPWPDPAVLFDLDTPEDYERLRTITKTNAECRMENVE